MGLENIGVNETNLGVSLVRYDCEPSVDHTRICFLESDDFSFTWERFEVLG